MNENVYYVYGYIRLDYNNYFYIGKGKKNRCYQMQNRSKHFENIIKNIPCAIEIIESNLSEQDAYLKEAEIIENLVFNEGYSIYMSGFEQNKCQHLVNRYWGGLGGSGGVSKPASVIEAVKKSRTGKNGSLNGMSKKIVLLNNLEIFDSIRLAEIKYNISGIVRCCKKINKYCGIYENGEKMVWRYYTDYLTMSIEEIELALNNAKIGRSKNNNSFYGKNHSEETKTKLRELNIGKKQSTETKSKYNRKGEKNSMYGKKGITNPNYGKPKSSECKLKLSKSNGTKIKCIELNIIFNSLNEAEKEMFNLYNLKINRKTIVNRMKEYSNKKWCGEIVIDGKMQQLHWEYVNL